MTGPTPASAGRYVGRFAPSPTGPLHAGSLVAALASWLDARAHDGRWLVRIEDIDTPRNVAGAAELILAQLGRCGLRPDGEVVHQSRRTWLYERALERLLASGWAYPCGCSRRDVADAAAAAGDAAPRRNEELRYPGTCRSGLLGKPARSIRLLTEPRSRPAGRDAEDEPESVIEWLDRRLGPQRQDVAACVGDFVLRRADGMWAYQLAVVVDDADQGVTDVVRGEDLAASTARQILLQRRLEVPTPRYLHTPVVLGRNGEKLSKQNGAAPLDLGSPLASLRAAAAVLGLEADGTRLADWLASAVARWRATVRS
ncbi:MAG TPA: tRNA glutamyl-Q(34) synthetase GluQRS [Caldimonas sp.]|jgi:glutamyl-Q tRNA(Asp) synthetase|nr:tRNA glutamyl-Q(34) synthetase GluQRS [Caldimonas sp.]HEX2540592.1 tRNA glutamyl-Q(34) synthetase GluQRS [Caldimonas sp.]